MLLLRVGFTYNTVFRQQVFSVKKILLEEKEKKIKSARELRICSGEIFLIHSEYLLAVNLYAESE